MLRRLFELIKSAPWILLPAILGEAVQHAAEYQFGMYIIGDGLAPGTETHVRSAMALIKVIGFLATILLARNHKRKVGVEVHAPLLLAAMLIAIPVAAHYALNYAAVSQPPLVTILLISIDCLVVGWLAATIGLVLDQTKQQA